VAVRILHVLDHSWPVMDGYSHRSRSIVSVQKSLGWEPSVVSGPLHGLDDPFSKDAVFDSVPYWRVPLNSGLFSRAIRGRWPLLREFSVVRLLEQKVNAILSAERFDVVHAHSPALCGLAASRASRSNKVPFVYEIRSFWEDGTDQRITSVRYRLARALETSVSLRADALVAIANPILKDMASRGADPSRSFCVPNGVDTLRFTPRPRDNSLCERFDLKDIPTIGFIGTLFPWEGVPWLIGAAAALRAQGQKFKLLIVGDGPDEEAVRLAISKFDAEQYVTFVGRVPHEDVERFYSVIDLLVYPRRSRRITEFVTPLKPLEAMALGRAVLGSGVGGIRELVEAGQTGELFEPESLEDFCRQASRLLSDPGLREKLGRQAREKILETSDWKIIVPRYEAVYETAIRHAQESRQG
jgi:glycogen(starch) synthase